MRGSRYPSANGAAPLGGVWGGSPAPDHIAIENPPSTGIAAPVTKSDDSLARKAAMPDMSRGVPQRPSGVRFSTLSCKPSTCWRARLVRSVSIQPGNTALTWIFSLAHAVASARVICTIPPFELAYGVAYGAPNSDIIEPMLIILPPPARFIA